ncbi:unnamed protein product [Ambrosiozyma monospora]|uniref:Unnamed protein product n=1 Tax=Ambrosiozyma monospora TaxID=43982 RepID=A0A9W6YY59_AMBMO|nr:unnamed protein product [Ambrosiozyma monospora]
MTRSRRAPAVNYNDDIDEDEFVADDFQQSAEQSSTAPLTRPLRRLHRVIPEDDMEEANDELDDDDEEEEEEEDSGYDDDIDVNAPMADDDEEDFDGDYDEYSSKKKSPKKKNKSPSLKVTLKDYRDHSDHSALPTNPNVSILKEESKLSIKLKFQPHNNTNNNIKLESLSPASSSDTKVRLSPNKAAHLTSKYLDTEDDFDSTDGLDSELPKDDEEGMLDTNNDNQRF